MLTALLWLALPAAFAEARADAGLYVVARPDALGQAWAKVGLPLAMHPDVARGLSRARDALGVSPLDERAWRAAGLRWDGDAVVTVGADGARDEAVVEVIIEVTDAARWEAMRKDAAGTLQAVRRGRFAIYSSGAAAQGRGPAAAPGLGRWLAEDAPLRAFAPAQTGCAGAFALAVRPRAGGLSLRGAWQDPDALALARPLVEAPPKGGGFFWMAMPRARALSPCGRSPTAADPLLEARQAPRRLAGALERMAKDLGVAPAVSVTFDAPEGPPRIAASKGHAAAGMRVAIARWLDALPKADGRAEALARSWLGQHFPSAKANVSVSNGALVCELLLDVR